MTAPETESAGTESASIPVPLIDPTLHPVPSDFGRLQVEYKAAAQGMMQVPETNAPIDLHIRACNAHIMSKFIYDDKQPAMVDVRTCQACGDTMVPLLAQVDSRDNDYLTTGLCPRCGHLQHIHRPPAHFYPEFYRLSWDPDRQDESNWPKVLPLQPILAARFRQFLPEGSRLLELGSGWGWALETFHQGGFAVMGTEASEHRSRFIREKLKLPCATVALEDIVIGEGEFQPESFDAFFSSHVLEHTFDPQAALRHLYDLLRPGGYAHLGLPCFYAENLMCHLQDLTHTCAFNPGSFRLMLENIGFELVEDYNSPHDLAVMVRKTHPPSEAERQANLARLDPEQPYRSMAWAMECLGLADVPQQVPHDLQITMQWQVPLLGRPYKEPLLTMQHLLLQDDGPTLDRLRQAVIRRQPIAEIAHLLPIRLRYEMKGAPLHYY